jgi:hypothetical protein
MTPENGACGQEPIDDAPVLDGCEECPEAPPDDDLCVYPGSRGGYRAVVVAEVGSGTQEIALFAHLLDVETDAPVSVQDKNTYLALAGWAPDRPGFAEITHFVEPPVFCALEGRSIRLEAWADALPVEEFPAGPPDFTAEFVGRIADDFSACD